MLSSPLTCIINESQLVCIENAGVCLETTHSTKTFLDFSHKDLSQNNLWLYESMGSFFLVEGLFTEPHKWHDTLLQGSQQICPFLNKKFSRSLSPSLSFEKQGIQPFAILQSFHRKYQVHNVYIALLLTYSESFVHRQATIHVPATEEGSLQSVYDDILKSLFSPSNMPNEPFIPPLLSYLKTHSPQHYAALVSAKAIPEKYIHPETHPSRLAFF